MATRTFIALTPEPEAVEAMVRAQREFSKCKADVRWVARENLHVTLKFLGNVKDEVLADVCRIADEAAQSIEAFEYDIAGISVIPQSGQMRMIWAEIADGEGLMTKLAGILNTELSKLGFPLEAKTFAPHITLGRVKSGRNVSQLRQAAGNYQWPDIQPQYADELIVFGSELTQSGPIYTPLSTSELG